MNHREEVILMQKLMDETIKNELLNDSLLLEGLNEQQKAAVTAPNGPAIVFAGPGSGKTTVLTRRVLYLLSKGIPAEKMMLVTFTRAAANEMRQRLAQIIPEKASALFIGTFHSLFLTLLREMGEMVPLLLSATEQVNKMREILSSFDLPVDDESISTYLQQIGLCKANLILPERIKVQKEKNIWFQKVYDRYEQEKAKQNVWDFDDILLKMYQYCIHPQALTYLQNRFEHILVDEFQDVNRLQYGIIVRMAEKHRNLFVVGDDDQAIYRFRGSDPKWMMEISKAFPEINEYQLTINYRSYDEIIQLSEKLIQRNRMRKWKKREGTGKRGARIEWLTPIDEEDEAKQLMAFLSDGKQTAILYRTSTQARALVDHLVRQGHDFFAHVEEHTFYRRFQIQDVFAYLTLAYDPNHLDSLVRIINKPTRYISGEAWIDACWNQSKVSGQSLVEVLPTLSGWKPFQKLKLQALTRGLKILPTLSAEEAIQVVCDEMGYRRYLETLADETGNDLDLLWEPVEELLLAAKPFSNGQAFIQHAKQVMNRLKKASPTAPIHLMSLHRSKGLEFERVILIGLHAGILPHGRSLQVPEGKKNEAWEEERRLFYVGMTRAERELILSISQKRQGKKMAPSPFVTDLGYKALTTDKHESSGVSSSKWKKRPATMSQPLEKKYISEIVEVGMRLHHSKFGWGIVKKVEPLSGVMPGRKIIFSFEKQTLTLHYELSRQLGLIQPEY